METMFMQNFGGQTKSIMVFLKVAYLGHSDLYRDYGKWTFFSEKTTRMSGYRTRTWDYSLTGAHKWALVDGLLSLTNSFL